MEACLYHPEHGFYTAAGGSAGRRGDFITSVEVGPLFGAVVARWLDHRWDDLGRPDPFLVLDVGAGPGTWARTVRAARPRCLDALALTLVEPSPTARAHHDLTIAGSVADLVEADAAHVVVANELLDNLPVRLIERADGRWSEVGVGPAGETLLPLAALDPAEATTLEMLAARDPLAERAAPWRVPVASRARRWLAEARALLLAGGRVLVFDYGVAATSELVDRAPDSWLRTYRDHQRGVSPFEAAGQQDITCEVCFDQLPPPDAFERQDAWLRRWGIDELVEEGRRVWTERAAIGDLAALRARSRLREAEALLDPDGLGAFWAAEWGPLPG